MRPGRIEMINPAYELLGDEAADSTEVGRMVPILRSHWRDRSAKPCGASSIRRSKNSPDRWPIRCPRKFWLVTNFLRATQPSSSCHFPPPTESLEGAEFVSFGRPTCALFSRSFSFNQLSVAMRKKSAQQQNGKSRFRVREPAIREAIKRVLPFKADGARRKRALAEKSRRTSSAGVPMNRLLAGRRGQRQKPLLRLEAATIVIEKRIPGRALNGRRPKFFAVQHFFGRREDIRGGAGYRMELLISGIEHSAKKKSCSRKGCEPARRSWL